MLGHLTILVEDGVSSARIPSPWCASGSTSALVCSATSSISSLTRSGSTNLQETVTRFFSNTQYKDIPDGVKDPVYMVNFLRGLLVPTKPTRASGVISS
jgi:hypothetical protein